VLYHTTKYGVVGLSESLRADLQANNIGVSVLCPGPVATKILETTMARNPAAAHMSAEQKAMIDQILGPTKKFLEAGVSPDAVGEMVLKGIRENALYIYTDRMMGPLIEARTKALLEAIPPA
jgi:short-subunit dehydrogenase